MSEICDKLSGCNETKSTPWSDISVASQMGQLNLNRRALSAPGLTNISLDGGAKSGAFFGPHPEIGDAITSWAKQAATTIGDYVQAHPYRAGAGIIAAALTHRLGESPIVSGAFGSIIATRSPETHSNLTLGSTSIDWSTVKPSSLLSRKF
jgi:hypothetical protein